MKKLFSLIVAGMFIGLTYFAPAHAFELQELPRDTAEKVGERLLYLWDDNTGIPVSRFKPLTDEVMVVKAAYAARLLKNEPVFIDKAQNPELFKDVDPAYNLVINMDYATQYFFGRTATGLAAPAGAYLSSNDLTGTAPAYTIHVKTISPNVGPRMYVVADIVDGQSAEGVPNVIGRMDITVAPEEKAPLGWSVLAYEISKPTAQESAE